MKPGPGVTTLGILSDTQMNPPMMVLTFQRLSLFDQLILTDKSELLALLQHQDPHQNWFQLVQSDINNLGPYCPDHRIVKCNNLDNV